MREILWYYETEEHAKYTKRKWTKLKKEQGKFELHPGNKSNVFVPHKRYPETEILRTRP